MSGAAARPVPRLEDDYCAAAADKRLAFLREVTGVSAEHIGRHGLDPSRLPGNVENFVGAAQVPIGVAGPLLVNGEHARGEFYVPLATTEGTLVASYYRGMKLLHAAGGVTTTIVGDVMQRAPAFGFASAREARAFGDWVAANFAAIKREAEATTRIGRLHDIEQFSASRYLFLRFNFTTGDAAGQNLAGKATRRACGWIRARYPGIRDFCLGFSSPLWLALGSRAATELPQSLLQTVITNVPGPRTPARCTPATTACSLRQPGPPRSGSTGPPGSSRSTTTRAAGWCSAAAAPRPCRCRTRSSPPAPFPAGTARSRSAAAATWTAGYGR
jgi:hypothetical protein